MERKWGGGSARQEVVVCGGHLSHGGSLADRESNHDEHNTYMDGNNHCVWILLKDTFSDIYDSQEAYYTIPNA